MRGYDEVRGGVQGNGADTDSITSSSVRSGSVSASIHEYIRPDTGDGDTEIRCLRSMDDDRDLAPLPAEPKEAPPTKRSSPSMMSPERENEDAKASVGEEAKTDIGGDS